MKGVLLYVLVTFIFLAVEAANRKANIRYLNSMPQFGKAKFSASSPQTLVFDQVSQGTLTDYTNIDSQSWSFTTWFATNVTAKSDETDLDSDSYATVYTCQQSQRRLKNKMIYDTARSINANKALLRTLNLAQYNYDIDVYNGSNTLFNSVAYCSASSYIPISPGLYEFDWTVSDDKKRQVCPPQNPHCGFTNFTRTLIKAGSAYTIFVTPSGSYVAQDAKKITTRSFETIPEAEASPITEEKVEKEEKMDVTLEAKEVKLNAQARRKKVSRRHLAQ